MHGIDGFFGSGWMMFLWWALIIFGVITLAKWMFAPKTTIPNNDIPLEILKRRYAKGAISPEEYQKLKHDLNE
ncbi:MAG: SHOCT domain-containing protein [Calditrichia bacterium]|nr:SHOCT domain-containing protein [Anaerolineae bacterium]MCB0285581.1 SHOCT domain-containing protein [Calditrichota bacterium]MCB9067207.1 SHOCT domain-containing protein [Calditrichia bacterium]